MKKLLICILCLASLKGFSQIRLGVQGSFSSLNFWQNDGISGLQANQFLWAQNGWQAGVFAEYDLGYSGLVVQPALMYATTGAHMGQTRDFSTYNNLVVGFSDTHLHINTLRLPINLLYTYRFNSTWKVFGGLGPYIAKNLSGTEEGNVFGYAANDYSTASYHIKNDIKLSGASSTAYAGNSNVASLDAGMDITLGFQWKKLQISGTWMRGFAREYHTRYVNMGNQDWNFTVGYVLFGHERKPRL
jgi:hypothetical protein